MFINEGLCVCLCVQFSVFLSVILYVCVSSAVGQVKDKDEMTPSKLGQHSSADYDHPLTY